MKSSREIADRVIAYIKRNPYTPKNQICEALGVTPDQFQAATPYIKSKCERIKTEWYLKSHASA